MPKQPTLVAAEEAVILTVGIPKGERGRRALVRLGELMGKHGYRAGVTSDEAILAAAERIQLERAAAAREEAATTTEDERTEGR